MELKIGVPKEILAGETRVAAVPETVKKMTEADMQVWVEAGAGLHAHINDQQYIEAGAKIAKNNIDLYKEANIILKVQKPEEDEIALFNSNSSLIAPLFPQRYPQLIKQLHEKQIQLFSLDLIPRIARAQSMDILSSMSNIAGYKSVILAADHAAKLFPMMTTAAGTILPAKIIVIGAGVAGLQAIATARRLGGVVVAFDTRPAAGEQVKSLGADFVSLETSHEQEDAGGYAKEQSAEFYQAEQAIICKYLNHADVIITTALIPGKRAPLLISEQMVAEMQPGSLIIDLAAEQGGNCALTEAGRIVQKNNVTIIG